MSRHAPMSCQVIYPLDAGGHTTPQLIVPLQAAIDLVHSPVGEWTVYLQPSEAQDIGRQIVRWLGARTNGAGFVEAMAYAITDKRLRGYDSIELETAAGDEEHVRKCLAVKRRLCH